MLDNEALTMVNKIIADLMDYVDKVTEMVVTYCWLLTS